MEKRKGRNWEKMEAAVEFLSHAKLLGGAVRGELEAKVSITLLLWLVGVTTEIKGSSGGLKISYMSKA